MTSLFTTPWQDAGGFVHNASALHTTPPAQQKPPRWTFDLSYKADIFTRHRHRVPGRNPRLRVLIRRDRIPLLRNSGMKVDVEGSPKLRAWFAPGAGTRACLGAAPRESANQLFCSIGEPAFPPRPGAAWPRRATQGMGGAEPPGATRRRGPSPA
jgi:hypothetical protein